jgi:pimeloyl-ACP methyl ester carboxylesterase
MQFDWMVQCYPGDGVHRDAPLLESLDRETTMAGVDAVEAAGLEGLWAPDHFMLGPHKQEYEVWTLLGALAERTDLEVGPLVGSITYRNPALLAKMATTVDHLSDGRLQLGLGAGWHDEEHAAYDFDFPPVDQRMEMLDEELTRERVADRLQWLFVEDVDDELVDIRQAIYSQQANQDAMRIIYETFVEDVKDEEMYFTTPELREMDVPTLVIHTEHNPSAQKELVEYVHEQLPDSEYHLYEHSAHWPQWEEQDRYEADTIDFLQRHT